MHYNTPDVPDGCHASRIWQHDQGGGDIFTPRRARFMHNKIFETLCIPSDISYLTDDPESREISTTNPCVL